MKTESSAYDAYTDFIIEVGAPNVCVSDHAGIYLSDKWKNINRKYCIVGRFTVPYHQSSNFAELIGGKKKYALAKLFHETPHAPYKYWCYGLEFLCLAQNHCSRRKLRGRTPISFLRGATPDISVFRFPWFSAVWYYAPTFDFPVDRMKPGFFIGIADTVGDGFSYLIIPGKSYKDIPLRYARPLVRSVVRLRDLKDDHSPVLTEREDGSYDIVDKHGDPLPDSDYSEEEILDHATPSVHESVEYADSASDYHAQFVDNSPLDSPPEAGGEISLGLPPFVAPADSAGTLEEGETYIDDLPYISLSKDDIYEEEVSGNALDLDPSDRLHDVVADQINIAMDPDTESTPDIIGITDHQWMNGTTCG